MSNIFEELDNLVKIASVGEHINESTKSALEAFPIDSNMETAEQARLYVRDYFAKVLEKDDGGTPPPDIPEPPKKISGPKPPPPPFKKKFKEEEGPEKKDWEEDETIWDEEDAMREMEMDDDEMEDEDDLEDEMEKEYDDFTDKASDGGSGSGGDDGEGDGDEDYDEDGDDDEDGEGDGDYDGESGEDGDGEGDESGEGGESGEGKGKGKGEKSDEIIDGGYKGDDLEGGDKESDREVKEGTPVDSKGKRGGESYAGEGEGTKDLRTSVDDAISRLKERADADKEKLKKLSDMAKEGASESEIEDVENDIDAEKDGKNIDKMRDIVGKMEDTPSEDELRKEIEESKVSDEDKKKLADIGDKAITTPVVADDAEMTRLKKEAVKELEKKCDGYSSLGKEILYHSLKDAKIESADWKKILEQILKDKSVNAGSEDSKAKRPAWGHKNHLWRGAILPTRVERVGGRDTQSVYCFVDYSGSVRSKSNLIMSFLGKVMELCINLKYTDMTVYTFADKLSLPKKLTGKMIEDNGYEKVLAQTIAFFEDDSNEVGGSIENFAAVANEVNKIKAKDRNAVIFVFGDGVWTFYGNTEPPMRLKEISSRWIKDYIFFVFYDEWNLTWLKKEIPYFKDEVGIKNVITTKLKDIKPDYK